MKNLSRRKILGGGAAVAAAASGIIDLTAAREIKTSQEKIKGLVFQLREDTDTTHGIYLDRQDIADILESDVLHVPNTREYFRGENL